VGAAPAGGPCDFNGDGFEDVPVAAHGEDVRGVRDAGAVTVLRSGRRGVTTDGERVLKEGSFGRRLQAVSGFGSALACGDFDGDGHGDLVIGAPWSDVRGMRAAGRVYLAEGRRPGLIRAKRGWRLGGNPYRHLGAAVAAGDFDGDGFDDVAVGAPGARDRSGAVFVMFGSPRGPRAGRARRLTENTDGFRGGPEAGDAFGAVLGVGDFNGNGRDDLVVGVPGEDLGRHSGAGAVNVVYFSPRGRVRRAQQITQGSPGVASDPERGDAFGRAVAGGDFDGDGFDELAVGAPFEDRRGAALAGVVHLFPGSPDGVRRRRDRVISQESRGVPSRSEPHDRFGYSLAVGRRTLAIGVPGEDRFRGAVVVKRDGVTRRFRHDTPGAWFGMGVRLSDLDGDGRPEVLASVHLKDVRGEADAGGFRVLGGRFVSQATDGVTGANELGDSFGHLGRSLP
jgi:hypothetical protein